MDIKKIEEAKKSLIVRAVQAREQALKKMGLWTCPECGFSFSTAHEDAGGGYSCPVCENVALSKANAEMLELLRRIKTEVDKFGRLVGIGDNFSDSQRICDAATAGPWGLHDAGLGKGHVYDTIGGVLSSVAWDARIDDAVFIAEARIGWPAALAGIERLRAELFSSMLLTQYDTAPKEDKESETSG